METIEGIERTLEDPNENHNASDVKVTTVVLHGVEDMTSVADKAKDDIEHDLDNVVGKIGISGHGV